MRARVRKEKEKEKRKKMGVKNALLSNRQFDRDIASEFLSEYFLFHEAYILEK
jgi:hypothetical protein